MKRMIKTLTVATILTSQQLMLPMALSVALPAALSREALAQRGRGGGARGGIQSRPASGNRVNRQPANRNTMNRDRTNSGRVNRERPETRPGSDRPAQGRPERPNQGGDNTFNRGGDRTNVINRGDVNINRNNINVNGRDYRRIDRNNVNINVRRNVYVGRPGWRTYGWYWGPYGVHAGFAWLSFLTAALLIGSYTSAQNNQTVYVYIVEEDGVEKEYHIDEDGEILSVEVVS